MEGHRSGCGFRDSLSSTLSITVRVPTHQYVGTHLTSSKCEWVMTDAYHDVLVAFLNISHVNHQRLTFVMCEWFCNVLHVDNGCHGWAVATKVFAGSSTRRNVLPRDRMKVYAAAMQAGI